MAEITAEAVKALRERTDLPMMECKKALIEAGGDQEKAVAILKQRAKGVIDKGKDRMTSEGWVTTLVKPDGSAGVIVEVRCESAPVARSEGFVNFSNQVAKQLLYGPGANSPAEIMAQPAPDVPGQTLTDLHEEIVNKIRENIVLARIARVTGPVAGYSHHNGSVGVLVQVAGANATAEVIRDVAMHVAALNPAVCLPEQLDPKIVAAEMDRQTAEAKASGKPDNIIQKIVAGKMHMFYANEGVLVEQPFAKDDKKTVAQALAEAGLKAVGFIRWRLGQG